MREPTRWRDPGGGADAETRTLLSNDAGLEPSADEVSRIWAGLESQLHLAPGPAHTPPIGSATTTAGAGALVGKITLAVVLVSAAGFGLHRLHLQDRPATKQAVPASPSAPRALAGPVARLAAPDRGATQAAPTMKTRSPRGDRTARSQPGEKPPTGVAPPPAAIEGRRSPRAETEERPLASSWGTSPWPLPSPATGSEPHPPARGAGPREEPLLPVNELLEESRQLGLARAALRAHDPDHALALLKSHTSRSTALAQEREALTIEALAAKPTLRAQATARARAFVKAYPQSPYRARIRAIALEGE